MARRTSFIHILVPKAFLTTLVFLSVIPYYIVEGFFIFSPNMILIGIFYWMLYSPQQVGLWFIFFIGLLEDFLGHYGIIGFHALTYVMFAWTVLLLRLELSGKIFMSIWRMASLLIAIFLCVKWLFYSILTVKILPHDMIIMQVLVTISVYPIFHWIGDIVRYHFAYDIMDD